MADNDIESGPEPAPTIEPLKRQGSSKLSDSGRPPFVRQLSDSLRNVATIVGPKQSHTFYCGICLEYVNVETSFTLKNCSHKFCHDCLRSFLSVKINESQVFPKCFGTANDEDSKAEVCGVDIDSSDIEKLVTSDLFVKYEKFHFNSTHENSRQCPKCDANLVGNPKKPEMQCNKCNYEFCLFHNDAHLGTTCVEYDKKMAVEDKLSRSLLSSTTKPCPGCKMPVEKIGGCNHMICPRCEASFCWICCRLVDKGELPTHFAWWNLAGCPNMQMTENETALNKFKCCFVLLSIIQTIIFGPVILVLVIATTLCCSCCLGFALQHERTNSPEKTTWEIFGSYIHASFELWSIFIILLILGLLALGIGCACSPLILLIFGLYAIGKKNAERNAQASSPPAVVNEWLTPVDSVGEDVKMQAAQNHTSDPDPKTFLD